MLTEFQFNFWPCRVNYRFKIDWKIEYRLEPFAFWAEKSIDRKLITIIVSTFMAIKKYNKKNPPLLDANGPFWGIIMKGGFVVLLLTLGKPRLDTQTKMLNQNLVEISVLNDKRISLLKKKLIKKVSSWIFLWSSWSHRNPPLGENS